MSTPMVNAILPLEKNMHFNKNLEKNIAIFLFSITFSPSPLSF